MKWEKITKQVNHATIRKTVVLLRYRRIFI